MIFINFLTNIMKFVKTNKIKLQKHCHFITLSLYHIVTLLLHHFTASAKVFNKFAPCNTKSERAFPESGLMT